MNNVVLVGRLTRDPELRYIQSTGKAVSSFSIAVDREFSGNDGQRRADFFNVVAWGNQAESIANYLGKGSQVAVNGRIENRNYETENGEKRYVTEIVASRVEFLSKKAMVRVAANLAGISSWKMMMFHFNQ